MDSELPRVRNDFMGNARTVVQVGSTEQVTIGCSADVERIELTVSHRPVFEAGPDSAEQVRAWTDAERSRLLVLADDYDWAQNRTPGVSLVPSFPPGDRRPDRRSRQDYVDQVEDYLKQTLNVLTLRRHMLMEIHELSCLDLAVENPTELHFRDVEFVVQFPAPIRGFDDEFRYALPSRWPDLPVVPMPPGTESMETHLHRVMTPLGRSTYRTRGVAFASDDVLEGWSAENDKEGTTVWFDSFDIRPGRAVQLPPVPLEVPLEVGALVEGQWTVTAGDANGVSSGELKLYVAPSTIDLAALVEPGPPTQGQPSIVTIVAELAAWYSARDGRSGK